MPARQPQGGIAVYARATTHRASPAQVDEAIVHYQDGIPSFSEIAGKRGAFLLVDRSAGKAISVTLWESEEVMRRADELRQPPAQESRGESVDEYEVAVWAVS
jgi:hypothetical protein